MSDWPGLCPCVSFPQTLSGKELEINIDKVGGTAPFPACSGARGVCVCVCVCVTRGGAPPASHNALRRSFSIP